MLLCSLQCPGFTLALMFKPHHDLKRGILTCPQRIYKPGMRTCYLKIVLLIFFRGGCAGALTQVYKRMVTLGSECPAELAQRIQFLKTLGYFYSWSSNPHYARHWPRWYVEQLI